ncbi:MAG: hypothetical protein NZM26_02050 [Patescibacteria group bacterium]|nr:hypothetical protein [Patescibacteria group bacterium]
MGINQEGNPRNPQDKGGSQESDEFLRALIESVGQNDSEKGKSGAGRTANTASAESQRSQGERVPRLNHLEGKSGREERNPFFNDLGEALGVYICGPEIIDGIEQRIRRYGFFEPDYNAVGVQEGYLFRFPELSFPDPDQLYVNVMRNLGYVTEDNSNLSSEVFELSKFQIFREELGILAQYVREIYGDIRNKLQPLHSSQRQLTGPAQQPIADTSLREQEISRHQKYNEGFIYLAKFASRFYKGGEKIRIVLYSDGNNQQFYVVDAADRQVPNGWAVPAMLVAEPFFRPLDFDYGSSALDSIMDFKVKLYPYTIPDSGKNPSPFVRVNTQEIGVRMGKDRKMGFVVISRQFGKCEQVICFLLSNTETGKTVDVTRLYEEASDWVVLQAKGVRFIRGNIANPYLKVPKTWFRPKEANDAVNSQEIVKHTLDFLREAIAIAQERTILAEEGLHAYYQVFSTGKILRGSRRSEREKELKRVWGEIQAHLDIS